VPYWGGDTYRHLPWVFVPRAIAPDKPTVGLGQAFGHRYGLLDRNDHKTAFNCAQIVEMYANFGSWGIAIGMLLVGMFYRALYRLINHHHGGDGVLMIAAVVFMQLLNIESSALLVLMGAPKTALVNVILLLLLARLAKVFQPRALGTARTA
jgi:hypothetical protein